MPTMINGERGDIVLAKAIRAIIHDKRIVFDKEFKTKVLFPLAIGYSGGVSSDYYDDVASASAMLLALAEEGGVKLSDKAVAQAAQFFKDIADVIVIEGYKIASGKEITF